MYNSYPSVTNISHITMSRTTQPQTWRCGWLLAFRILALYTRHYWKSYKCLSKIPLCTCKRTSIPLCANVQLPVFARSKGQFHVALIKLIKWWSMPGMGIPSFPMSAGFKTKRLQNCLAWQTTKQKVNKKVKSSEGTETTKRFSLEYREIHRCRA